MGLRGPPKGQGGRPRVAKQKPNAGGYIRSTNGPKGAGTLGYAHRAIASGIKPGSITPIPKSSKSTKTGVVDHLNHNRADNRPANLKSGSRAANNRNKSK